MIGLFILKYEEDIFGIKTWRKKELIVIFTQKGFTVDYEIASKKKLSEENQKNIVSASCSRVASSTSIGGELLT